MPQRFGARLAALVLAVAAAGAAGQQPAVEVPHEAGARVSGRVLDARGLPVAGAYVELRPVTGGTLEHADWDAPPADADVSAPDGSYVFAPLEPGAWLLTAVSDTREVAAHVAVRLDRGSREREDLVLPVSAPAVAAVAEGRLVGAFLPEEYLYVVRAPWRDPVRRPDGDAGRPPAPRPEHTAVPDGSGRFRLGPMDAGGQPPMLVLDISVRDVARPAATHRVLLSGLREPARRVPGGVAEHFVPELVQLTLEVVPPDVEPLPRELRVRASGWTWTADLHVLSRTPAGAAEMLRRSRLLPPGSYVVEAEAGRLSMAPRRLVLRRGDAPHAAKLELVEPAPIAFDVRDPSGAPARVTMICVRPAWDGVAVAPIANALAPGGRALLEGVLPGTYDVEFHVPGGAPIVRRLDLAPGMDAVVLE